MILDTSALAAIFFDEPERQHFVELILAADEVLIAAPTVVELSMVVDGIKDPVISRKLDDVLRVLDVQVIPFDETQARVARTAFRDFGKGSGHRARLNFGDCISYAAATVAHQSLLFKGNDFVHTDVVPADTVS